MPVLECARCNELYYSAHGSTELSCDACGASVWRIFEDEVSFARVSGLPRRLRPGDHGVLVYTDRAGAADFCASYLREGLTRDEHVFVVLPGELREAVAERLSPDERETVEWHEPADLYRDFHPETVADRFVQAARAAERTVRFLAGPDAAAVEGKSADAWAGFEELAHERALELRAVVLCVYDSRALPMAYSPMAVSRHPLISRNGSEVQRNSDFRYAPAA
jgi:DcmR-like sensory protein